jgi:dipeptidyl-peptidase-4
MNKFITLLSLICTSAFAQKEITLEDIWIKGTFKTEAVAGFRSMNDGNYYTEINEKKELQKVSFQDGKVVEILADFSNILCKGKKVNVDEYIFNEAQTKMLLLEGPQNIYRRSVLYNVYVYNLATKSVIQFCDDKILHATFSPQGDKVAYVKSNNLYVYDLSKNKEIQISKDGEWNKIINGNCDWVYEEEFGFTQAFEWSPDGKYLAFYKFDESKVPEFNFAKYDNLYPTDVRFKYPKAGEKNSTISIQLLKLQNNKVSKINIGNDTDIYIPRIKWNVYDGQLLIYQLNRKQNNLNILGYQPNTNKITSIYSEINNRYVEIKDEIIFLKNENSFLHTSEKSGYNHIWKFNLDTKQDVQITKGNWEVVQLLSTDEKLKKIYYTSTEESPLERHLYSILLNGNNKEKITNQSGTHLIECSNGCKFYLDVHSSINTPAVSTICNNSGSVLRIVKDNAKLKTIMKEFTISTQELIKVPNGLGENLNAWVIKPANSNDGKKHPLLMFQYSGPGSQQVTNSFMGRDYWWYQMLAQKGYVIACVDGRGTGFRGEEFKKCTYKQLGKLESDDQIAAAKYFGTLPYIDKDRIGIWGWSYGGYMSSICILKGADVFKSAIAVAPVTNWRYYDNIYTERYMQKPQDNASGYDDNSPVNMVSKLKGNYYLIHGSADDNVHYQNSMEMINALIKADKDFDSEAYPNRAHGISGGNTRYHLYKRLTKFVLEKI